MSSKQLVYVRRFLNKAHDYGLASILADLSYTEYDTQTALPYLGTESRLEISDCDRIIKLSLPVNTLDGIKLSKRKLNILIETLERYRNGLDKLEVKKKAFDAESKQKIKHARKKEARKLK